MENNKEKEYEGRRPEEEQAEDKAMAAGAEAMAQAEAVESEGIREESEEETVEKRIAGLEAQVANEKKEYLFLMAEFDNFRKRTLKEKAEIIRNAGENVLKGLLPIMDDFERGIKASEGSDDVSAVKEGMVLIYNKLKKYLAQNGVKEMDPDDDNFDTEKHEAISVVPVPDEAKKGKILDTVEKGYMINDKVLRHAKVVVGQ